MLDKLSASVCAGTRDGDLKARRRDGRLAMLTAGCVPRRRVRAGACAMLDEWSRPLRGRAAEVRRWDRQRRQFSMQSPVAEGELLRWKGQGLPTDKLSSENAIVILNALNTPLIIDPSSQATEWLKTNLQASGGSIEVLVPHEARFATALELGVRFGKTLVVQEVDVISPILVPLLRKDLAPGRALQVGDKLADYTDGFRMFLATRNRPAARRVVAHLPSTSR